MKIPRLPFYQQGWFYLWLGLMMAVLWANQNQWFEKISFYNLQLLSKVHNSSVENRQVNYLSDVNLLSQSNKKLSKLFKDNFNSVFVYIGNKKSNVFDQYLTEKSKLVILTNNASSLLPISENLTNKFFVANFEEVEWKISHLKRIAVQPNQK